MSGRPKLDMDEVRPMITAALEEDLGDGDITTLWTVGEDVKSRADIIAKEPGVVAGIGVVEAVFRMVDPNILFEKKVSDGTKVEPMYVLAEVSGSARGILTGERTALNFLQRMSGIATATAKFMDAVAGTGTKILDTRKTAPGLRVLDKYAVAAGGGSNHRFGLFDMVLIKENHINAAGGVGPAVLAAKEAMLWEGRKVKVEVEIETLDQLEDAISSGADWIMLDNMEFDKMRRAVRRVWKLGNNRPRLEASGNVTIGSISAIAETGVDLISVGELTHSVQAFDTSLLFR